MSEQKMDAERAAFEDWADGHWPGAKREQLKCDAYGEYLNSIYRDLWRGWQARASLPVGVPEGWPTDDMVVRGAEELHDSLRQAGVYHDFDAGLNGTEMQQGIAETVFLAMLASTPAVKVDPAQCTNEDSWNCKYCRKTESCEALKDKRNFGDQPPALPVAGVEEVGVVGYRFFHVDHGYIFRRTHIYEGNPSLEADGLMTVAQHNRIVAALSAQQAEAVSVPEWIAVTDRLPAIDEPGRVLVLTKTCGVMVASRGGPVDETGEFVDGWTWDVVNDISFAQWEVTHWMPIDYAKVRALLSSSERGGE